VSASAAFGMRSAIISLCQGSFYYGNRAAQGMGLACPSVQATKNVMPLGAVLCATHISVMQTMPTRSSNGEGSE